MRTEEVIMVFCAFLHKHGVYDELTEKLKTRQDSSFAFRPNYDSVPLYVERRVNNRVTQHAGKVAPVLRALIRTSHSYTSDTRKKWVYLSEEWANLVDEKWSRHDEH